MALQLRHRVLSATLLLIAWMLGLLVVYYFSVGFVRDTYRTERPQCAGCFQWSYRVIANHWDICLQRDNLTIDLIFLIPSVVNGRAQRDAIRSTWASITRNNTSNFRHVFLFGEIEDPERLRDIQEESRRFRDVVILGFHDSYRNLTVKTLMSLRWLTENCPQARFFLKVDDDMWVNSRLLMEKLVAVENGLQTATAGYCKMSPSVIRKTDHKWVATYAEYPAKTFPRYCSGTAYAGTVNLVRQVVNVSKNVPFIHLENVFIGLCLSHLGYSIQHLEGFHITFPEILDEDACAMWKPQIVTAHGVSSDLMHKFWTRNCGKRTHLLPRIIDVP